MRTVQVHLGQRSYDIVIGRGLLSECGSCFQNYSIGNRIFLVASTTVWGLYGDTVFNQLVESGFDVTRFLIPDGETAKNIHTVENIYTYLIAQKADRNSTLAALGGGVTGDVVGFVAATFLRGVHYVQIPTTLLAQVDSSVGGKTGVNHRLGKNLIGAFYQPDLVCVDTASLSTLPQREFQAGLYEVIKYGLIYDVKFFGFLEENLEAIKKRDPEALETLISRCCEIKAEVISIDEREESLRRILNFGHTLGHALEAATGYERLKHGEAVGYGMLAAAFLSHHKGDISAESLDRINEMILRIGPLPPIEDITFAHLLDAIKLDKKRQDDQVVVVLLREIGKTSISSGIEESRLDEAWQQALQLVSVPGSRV
jgi:3-dehydroquinate synthase